MDNIKNPVLVVYLVFGGIYKINLHVKKCVPSWYYLQTFIFFNNFCVFVCRPFFVEWCRDPQFWSSVLEHVDEIFQSWFCQPLSVKMLIKGFFRYLITVPIWFRVSLDIMLIHTPKKNYIALARSRGTSIQGNLEICYC